MTTKSRGKGSNDQTILRVARRVQPWSTFGNKMLQDKRMSLEAKGFLVSMLSRPPHWKFNFRWAKEEHNVGRDKLYRLIDELITLGYCKRHQPRIPGGSWGQTEYYFIDDPTMWDRAEFADDEPHTGFQEAVKSEGKTKGLRGDSPFPENPDTDKPDPGFQDAYIKERQGETERQGEKKEPLQERAVEAADASRKGRGRRKAQSDLALQDRERADEKASSIATRRDVERAAFDQFRAFSREMGLREVAYLTPRRRLALAELLRNFGVESWDAAIEQIRQSDFLQGQSDSGWTVDFDKMMDFDFYARLLEGRYNRHAKKVVPIVDQSKVSAREWRGRVNGFTKDPNRWQSAWGPRPGDEGCLAPVSALEEFGFASDVA